MGMRDQWIRSSGQTTTQMDQCAFYVNGTLRQLSGYMGGHQARMGHPNHAILTGLDPFVWPWELPKQRTECKLFGIKSGEYEQPDFINLAQMIGQQNNANGKLMARAGI